MTDAEGQGRVIWLPEGATEATVQDGRVWVRDVFRMTPRPVGRRGAGFGSAGAVGSGGTDDDDDGGV